MLAVVMLSGCATGRTIGGVPLEWRACGAAGAVAGGAIGATENAGAAIGGALIGGLIGVLTCREPVKAADADADTVPDSADRCPGTPVAANVDATGCEMDSDGDGVPDRLDLCARTPPWAKVNAAGCEVLADGDGDGVPDLRDECPSTTPAAAIDAAGCEPDGDADGVADAADLCPGTTVGHYVDRRGCEPDADRDGVPDDYDLCPGTATTETVDDQGCRLRAADADHDGIADDIDRCRDSPPGAPVDARGCPLPRARVLGGVGFDSGSARLGAGAGMVLDEVASLLRGDPALTVRIGGHTDGTGSRATNRRLSEQRAQAVRRYLIEQGIDPDRLSVAGYGPDRPLADNGTPAGRAANRRVEIEFQ
jgi:outer membrane protein OmpA-like peptidoglycan-associated protein